MDPLFRNNSTPWYADLPAAAAAQLAVLNQAHPPIQIAQTVINHYHLTANFREREAIDSHEKRQRLENDYEREDESAGCQVVPPRFPPGLDRNSFLLTPWEGSMMTRAIMTLEIIGFIFSTTIPSAQTR